jgi:hypothetical protein
MRKERINAQSPVVIAGVFIIQAQRFRAMTEDANGSQFEFIGKMLSQDRPDDLKEEIATDIDDRFGHGGWSLQRRWHAK